MVGDLPTVGLLPKWQKQQGMGQANARSQETHPGLPH